MDAQRSGKPARDAIFEGALVRFRPIMMTTLAAIMGVLRIALGFGAGAEVRRSLELSVIGRLLLSQLLALYVTPVVYRTWMRRRAASARDSPPGPAG